MVTKAMSDVTSAMERLSVELEIATGRSCLPLDGWMLMAPDISVIMGSGGFRGMVMEKNAGNDGRAIKDCLKELENADTAGAG